MGKYPLHSSNESYKYVGTTFTSSWEWGGVLKTDIFLLTDWVVLEKPTASMGEVVWETELYIVRDQLNGFSKSGILIQQLQFKEFVLKKWLHMHHGHCVLVSRRAEPLCPPLPPCPHQLAWVPVSSMDCSLSTCDGDLILCAPKEKRTTPPWHWSWHRSMPSFSY